MNFIGQKLHLRIFGASHEPRIGMTLTGFPAGEKIDAEALEAFLARRAPGGRDWSTPRREADLPLFLSGLAEGMSDGGPITAEIRNRDVRRADYEAHASIPRPGHADYTAWVKDGAIPSGGGAFSCMSGYTLYCLCILHGSICFS